MFSLKLDLRGAMPRRKQAKRTTVKDLRSILRLTYEQGLSVRAISERLQISKTSVATYLLRAREAGLSWPLPPIYEIEGALQRALFRRVGRPPQDLSEPEWPRVAQELKRKGVTLTLLWQEYRTAHPDGYGYTWFCEKFAAYQRRANPTFRHRHAAGAAMQTDYAGPTVEVIDPQTGEVRQAQIFVAVLGASSLTFAMGSFGQRLPDWIEGQTRALSYFGGVPKAIVCDNLKAGVVKALWFEPTLNQTFAAMAEHYDTTILPTRSRKPRDKTSVSYCTLFWRLRGDGDETGRAGVAPSAAFEDGLVCGQRPQATIQMVTTAFYDQPLTAPLVDGGFRDAKPGSDLACREHATAA
jgi:transposase